MLVVWSVLAVWEMWRALAVVSSFNRKSDRNDPQKPADSGTCMTNQEAQDCTRACPEVLFCASGRHG